MSKCEYLRRERRPGKIGHARQGPGLSFINNLTTGLSHYKIKINTGITNRTINNNTTFIRLLKRNAVNKIRVLRFAAKMGPMSFMVFRFKLRLNTGLNTRD